jgi:hypothetical protein
MFGISWTVYTITCSQQQLIGCWSSFGCQHCTVVNLFDVLEEHSATRQYRKPKKKKKRLATDIEKLCAHFDCSESPKNGVLLSSVLSGGCSSHQIPAHESFRKNTNHLPALYADSQQPAEITFSLSQHNEWQSKGNVVLTLSGMKLYIYIYIYIYRVFQKELCNFESV